MTTLEYILAKQLLRLDGAVEDLLLVDRFQDLTPAPDRRLYKCLTLTQLQKRFGFFVLLFVLLKGFVYVFAVFRIDDKHIVPLFLGITKIGVWIITPKTKIKKIDSKQDKITDCVKQIIGLENYKIKTKRK